MHISSLRILLAVALLFVVNFSCSKLPAEPSDPCAGKHITVTATLTPASGTTVANGAITATAAGSTNFSFSLNNGTFQNSGSFTNLAPGNYSIVAKDADGCTGAESFVVTAIPCPNIVVTAAGTNVTSTTATDGTITASATGSTGFTFSINGGSFQASGNFTALAAGLYTVTAKDANGCTGTAAVVITNPSCPVITVTATSTQASGPTATNGSITATASGGVAPHTYSKDGTNYQASAVFSNLAVGNYTILAKDANGCIGTPASVAVTSLPCPGISISSSIVGSDKCSNNTGTVTVTASGSSGFMYKLNSGSFQSSNVFTGLATGTYTITVADANGCANTQAATVPVGPAGANFANVKAVLAANCAVTGCHAGPTPQNGLNFTDDCTIVTQGLRIKARAVDANPSVMPPTGAIPASERQKIVNWINAGGQYSN